MPARSAAQRPPAKRDVPGLTKQAAHENELMHAPPDRWNGPIGDEAVVVKQRQMWRELRLYVIPEAVLRHRSAGRLLNRLHGRDRSDESRVGTESVRTGRT